jgi:tetratricopeptide (TPR) repeat protein
MEIKQVTDLVGALQRAKGDASSPCGKAVFLVGAGCSKSAGIPLGGEIANQRVGKLAKSYSNGKVDGTNPADALAWLKANKKVPEHIKPEELYGFLFEQHDQDPTEQQRIILDAIKNSDGKINWAHLCLGELVNQHYIHTVLTTNFDQLVLEGIIQTGILPVVADGVESLTRVSGKPYSPQVVHLHGSMHTYHPLNSSSAVKETAGKLPFSNALYKLLSDSSLLVVVGYAGGEEGVMSVLIESAKNLQDKVIYWVQHSPNQAELSAKASELLNCGKNKFLVLDQDADAFFAELMKGLELGTPDWMKHPIASLQKHAVRIVPGNKDEISKEVEHYRNRLNKLESTLGKENKQEKILSKIRELRLAGKHLEALKLFRKLNSLNAPKVWRMWADSAYEMGQRLSDIHLLEESITSWEKAQSLLQQASPPADRRDWLDGQNNLGNALIELGRLKSDKAILEKAIVIHREVLKERPRERDPMEWAKSQNNLGSALAILGKLEHNVAKLEEAVEVSQEALQERTRERVPLFWAMTKSNLGCAFFELGMLKSDKPKLEEAVVIFGEVLKEYTHERDPMQWASAQSNLGNVLLAWGELGQNVEKIELAEDAYRKALQEVTRERRPLYWAETQYSRGKALFVIGVRGLNSEKLEHAVAAFRDALKEYTRERDPMKWASIQHFNGMSLSELGQLRSDRGRLENAVIAYREALQEFTRKRIPMEWARIQHNLGIVLRVLGEGDSDVANLEQAKEAVLNALGVFREVGGHQDVQMAENNLQRILALIEQHKK